MTDETTAGPSGGDTAVIAPPNLDPVISTHDAARALSKFRAKQPEETQAAPVEAKEPPPVEQPTESAGKADAAPQAEVPGETQATDQEQEAAPPIEPPRSWTKEARERFAALPRETQEYIAEREQERDREVRRSQNEVADAKKALEADKQAISTARQQYEAALPSLMQALTDQTSAHFSDIKTMADVEKLARDDWPRYIQWDAHQKKVHAVQAEMANVAQRQAQEYQNQWTDFARKQDASFIEKAPEFADKAKAQKLQETAIDVLEDRGFTKSELTDLYNGKAAISLRDHRIQLLILDAVKYAEGQKAVKAAVEKTKAKPVPPVVRPGTASERSDPNTQRRQALEKRLELNAKDGAELARLRRAARQ